MKEIILSIGLPLIIILSGCNSKPLNSDEWLKKNANRLEGITFKEFAEIPIENQGLIFDKLPSNTKANIWRQKVDALLEKDWSEDKEEVIKGLYNFTISEAYTPSGIAKLEPQIKEWHKIAKKNFSDNQLLIMASSMKLTLDNEFKLTHREYSCTCSIGSEFSCSGCGNGLTNCSPRSFCGFIWMYTCDGICPT